MCGKLPKSGSAWPQLVRRTRYIFGGKNETREGERGITPTWLTRFFVLGANLLPTESYTGLRVTLGYTELRVFYVGNQPPRLSEPQQAGDGVATIAIIEPLQKQNKNFKPDENSESYNATCGVNSDRSWVYLRGKQHNERARKFGTRDPRVTFDHARE